VLALAGDVAPDGRMTVVVGPEMEAVRAEALRLAPGATVALQAEQRGTADAVLAAREAIAGHNGDVLVLYADTPLLKPATLKRLLGVLDGGAQIAVLGFRPADPTGYGRLLTGADGALHGIREEKDATAEERRIGLCNSGVMAFRCPDLVGLLSRIGSVNAKGEYYLTDAVELGRAAGLMARVVEADEEELIGVNSRVHLADAEAIFQRRARVAAMENGATLIDPSTVWLSFDTQLGRDVIIEPNVVFGPGVVVEDNVVIKANSHLDGADAKSKAGVRVRQGAEIGPYARLRPGADIGPGAHIGNFVEVKNVTVGAGAKANHLTYLGDGTVGPGANIGAGTIFCNYDGFNKHRTEVGAGAFIGSNAALVAPVRIGDGAYIGSGSVITKNVEAGALALERAPQETRPGWAARFREHMLKRKAERK
jgi:bifunctional UDP-N-acetylglucosamine pyrophosphorylase/glucosamine-1-phosphate N-acetyltransferase